MSDEPENLALRRQLRDLAQDRPPPRDLWPQIAAALPQRRQRSGWRRPRPALWAMAAGLVVALGLVLVPAPVSDPLPVTASAGVASPGVLLDAQGDSADVLLTAYDQVLSAERDWRGLDRATLAVPGARERVAAARELDASLAQLAAALRIAPESQLLRRLMHQTLQQRTALTHDSFAA
jgi:hypothetical protein